MQNRMRTHTLTEEQNDYLKSDWTVTERANNIQILIQKINSGYPTKNMIDELALGQKNAQVIVELENWTENFT